MAKRRRSVKKSIPPVWPVLVLDSGGLTQAAANTEDARAALDITAKSGARAIVPAVVLAETLRGNRTDANVNRILKGFAVSEINEAVAREAATIKNSAGFVGVERTIDAIVVAVTILAGGGVILTTDPSDIRLLASTRPSVDIRAISV